MLYSELQFNLLTLNIYFLESKKVVVESLKYVTFYGTNILKVEIFKFFFWTININELLYVDMDN